MADLAELGIIYVEQGWEAAMQHMSDYKDVAGEVVQSEEDRVKAAGKVIQSQAALSDQIAKTTVAFNSSKSAQYEFQAAALGVTDQLQKQIAFLKNLEEQAAFTAEAQKASAQWARQEEGALLDLAKDIQYLNKVRAQEAAEAEANRKKELASRDAYYAKIVADAKAAEQAITDAKHKAILDQQNATAKAAAMYIKDEQDRVKAAEKAATDIARVQKKASDDAARTAEQAAIAEIQWARKSRDEQLRIKEEIATYKKAGVSDATIGNMFGSGALNGSINEVHTLAEKWDHVRMNTSRARSEMVVLAHEIVQGRFSRIPASLMVFAEYTDITALAMSGLGLAIMGAVAAIAAISIAMVKGMLEQRDLQNALIVTGNYAGTTAGALDDVAHSAVGMGGSIGTAKAIILELAKTGKFTSDQIGTVTTAVVQMEHATGGGEETVKQLVDAFKSLQVEANAHSRYSDEVTKAVLKLDAQYHFLTTSVLAQIRALEDEGKVKEASAIATNEFARVTEDRAKDIVANLGTIEHGWRAVKESIGEAWSAIKDWGKSETAQSKLRQAAIDLETIKRGSAYGITTETSMFGGGKSQKDLETEALKRYNDAWNEIVDTQKKADEQGKKVQTQSASNRALADIEIEGNQLKVDKLDKLTVALEKYRANLQKLREDGNSADTLKQLRPEVIEAHEAALTEKFRDKSKKVTDSYDRIAAAIEAADQKALVSIATGEKVSAADKLRIDIMRQINLAYEDGTLSVAKKEKAIRSLNKAVEDTKAADAAKQRLKDEEDALVVIDKLQDEAAKSYDKMIKAALDAAEKTTKSLDAQIAKQIAHNSEIGKTKEQIELARAAREDAEVKELQGEADRITALIAKNDVAKEYYGIVGDLTSVEEDAARRTLNALDQEILRRKQLKSLLLEGAVLEANAAAAKLALATWKKGWEDVDKLAQGAFAGWALKGKSAAEMIGEALKTALVDAIYQATLRPIVAQVYVSATSALGIPGVSGGGGTIGSLLNTASSGNSLYNNISGLFGGSSAASSAYGFAGLAGAGNAAGLSATLPALSPLAIESGITSMGTSIFSIATPATTGVTLGTLAPSLGSAAATTTLGTAVTAPLAAGAAPALGIPGIGWAIGGALLLAGLFGGDNGPKLQSTGDAIRRYDKDGALTENGTNGAWFFTNTEAANKLLDGLESRYQQSAKALGIGTVATQFDYGSNNRGNFALAGAAGNSSANTGEIAYSAEAMQVAASRAVFAALQGSELPKYLSGLLDSVGDINALSQAQIEDVLNTAQAFKGLHDSLTQLPFDGLKDMSYRAAKALVEFSGGLDKFGQNLGTYYDNFYSAEEKKAQTLKNISKRLGESGVTATPEVLAKMTREGFRALVEGIQGALSPEASSKMVAALLEVSGAFASVTPAAASLADTNAKLAKEAEAAKTAQEELTKATREAAIAAGASARAALLDNATTGAQDAFGTLSRSVAAQQAKDAAANAAQRAIATAAFTSQNELYQQKIDSTRKSLDAVGQSVGKLQSLSGSLRSTLDGMRIAGSEGAYRADAQAQIRAALTTARSGGGLPLDGQLASALSTVSKPSEQLFSTFQDYARDFYKTANDIAALGDLTNAQLSADQVTQGILQDQITKIDEQKKALKDGFSDQVSALDDILTNAQLQLDAANGLNVSVLSVADALKAFASAVTALESTRSDQGLATTVNPTTTAAATERQDTIRTYMQSLAQNTSLSDVQKARVLADRAKLVGVTEAETARAWGVSDSVVRAFYAAADIPQFAVGTDYVPKDMLAMIHEGERITPKAFNPAAGAQGSSNNADVVTELRALRSEVASLRSVQEQGNINTNIAARILDGQQQIPWLVKVTA